MANKSQSLVSRFLSGPRFLKTALQGWLGVPITLQSGGFWRDWSIGQSWIGKPVTVDQALQLSTVWSCVRLISETLATLPLGFYKRNPDGSRTAATSHQLYEILHNAPNADMTAVIFWETVASSLLLWGNSYVEVIRSGAGAVISLHFLHPARMVVRRLPDGTIEYRYRDYPASAVARVIPEANLMHIPAFSTDGLLGLSPIAYGANVMGTAIETDKASAETFRDAMRSPGIVTMDVVMSKDQREELRQHINKTSQEGGVMVVEKGTGFQKLTFDPVDAELLASRHWNVEEMCRWYRVDPAMIGHGGKDSNWGTGLEQKMIWFLTFTLRHWCVRIEQAVRKNLLSPVERQTYFAEFALEGLLRADSAARATFYSTMTQNGVMTRDECRRLENLSPMGGNAKVLTVQVQMMPIDLLGVNVTPPKSDTPQTTLPAPMPHSPPQDPASKERHELIMAALLRPPPPLALHMHDGAIRVESKLEPSRIEFAPGSIHVEPAVTTVNVPPAEHHGPSAEEVFEREEAKKALRDLEIKTLLQAERNANEAQRLAEERERLEAEPPAPVAPAPGTVLKETTKSVTERDDAGRIRKVIVTEGNKEITSEVIERDASGKTTKVRVIEIAR